MTETTFNLETKNGPVEFESTLADSTVQQELALMTRSNFAQDLSRTYCSRGWSPKQRAWAHYLVWQASQPKPEPQAGFGAIVDLFTTAAESRKFPRLWFEVEIDGEPTAVVLKRAGDRSAHPGTINVTNGEPYGSPQARWFGRIDLDGATRIRQPEVLDLLERLAVDPEAVAAEHGKTTGNCCFCHRTLTDSQSIAAGFGPVCAQNWGLTAQYAAAGK